MPAPRIALIVATTLFATAAAADTRCGWLHNPTPGNWWLTDAQGEWTLMTQGGPEPAGMEAMPDISARDYVRINGNYGYACACLTGAFDAGARRVVSLKKVGQKRLAACRKDRALPKP